MNRFVTTLFCLILSAFLCIFQARTATAVNTQLRISQPQFVVQGHETTVDIIFDGGDSELGGFEFLIKYNPQHLALIGATEGNIFEDYGWEYFTFRFALDSTCVNSCQTGELRIIGLANLENGQSTPSSFLLQPGDVFAKLRFSVSANRTDFSLDCRVLPIRFYWSDCSDNLLISPLLDSHFISASVFDYKISGAAPINRKTLTDFGASLPSFGGATDSCVAIVSPNEILPLRNVDFLDGGVGLACPTDGGGGDLNLNGFPYEISDAVMYVNYFTGGIIFLGSHIEGSIAESEVNGDGIPLTVADLVFLIQVIIGEEVALGRRAYHSDMATITKVGDMFSTNFELGGALFEFRGEVDVTLKAKNMSFGVGIVDGNTRALVYSLSGEAIAIGDVIESEGELLSVELSDLHGASLEAGIIDGALYAQTFTLNQNYPNPFNPTTTITYSLPEHSRISISIYNILGQNIKTLGNGVKPIGAHSVEWDGTDDANRLVASGIYYYKLIVDGSTIETKKMVLLK